MEDINSIHALAYFNLLKTSSWIEDQVKIALKPFGITHAQLNVLHILYENHPKAVSANELKSKILVSNPDVTRLLDRLVKKDLVIRSTCPENRRKIDISLTDAGIVLFKDSQLTVLEALGSFFTDKISSNEAAELRNILHKIRM